MNYVLLISVTMLASLSSAAHAGQNGNGTGGLVATFNRSTDCTDNCSDSESSKAWRETFEKAASLDLADLPKGVVGYGRRLSTSVQGFQTQVIVFDTSGLVPLAHALEYHNEFPNQNFPVGNLNLSLKVVMANANSFNLVTLNSVPRPGSRTSDLQTIETFTPTEGEYSKVTRKVTFRRVGTWIIVKDERCYEGLNKLDKVTHYGAIDMAVNQLPNE
jgi:hypothetical protein